MIMANFLPQPQLALGTYRHYKGGLYEVIGFACDEATLTWRVMYKPLYEHDGPEIWLRTYEDFTSEVKADGEIVTRFVLLTK